MGMNKRPSAGITRYYQIYHGDIVHRIKEAKDGYEKKTSSTGKTFYQDAGTDVTGALKRVLIKKPEKGSQYAPKMQIVMQDGEGMFVVESSIKGGYIRDFIKRIFNCDVTKPMRLTPYYFDEDGDISTYMGIHQEENGEWVKKEALFSKDNPNGVPPPIQKPDGTWDFSAQEAFLYKKIQTEIWPALDQTDWQHDHESNRFKAESKEDESAKEEVKTEDKPSFLDAEEDDDLPF